MSDLNEIKWKLEKLKNLNARGEEWEYFQVLNSIADSVSHYNNIYPNKLWLTYEQGNSTTYAAFPDQLIKQIKNLE